MSAANELDPAADPVATFGRDAYYHLIYTLSRALPPLPTEDPDICRRRDHAVIARIAAMVPANPTEAEIAGLYVAASEQWKDCLRLAQLPETSPKQAMQCRNQANAMMRQAQGALRLLLRMQAVREKREATNQSCDRAAFTEFWNTTLMAEALAATAEPPPEPAPAPEPEPCPVPRAAAKQSITLYPLGTPPIHREPRVPDGIALIAANGAAFPTPDEYRPSEPVPHYP